MKDLIERQAAIDALCNDKCMEEGRWRDDGVCKPVMRIMALPSAQPEIIRCGDCKHRYTDECPMRHVERVAYDDDGYIEYDDVVEDYTCDDGFCHKSERRTDD